MHYLTSRKLMFALSLGGIFCYAFATGTKTVAFYVAALVLLLGGLLQAVVFYRCPHCGKSLLPYRNGVPKHCPECGEELSE